MLWIKLVMMVKERREFWEIFRSGNWKEFVIKKIIGVRVLKDDFKMFRVIIYSINNLLVFVLILEWKEIVFSWGRSWNFMFYWVLNCWILVF